MVQVMGRALHVVDRVLRHWERRQLASGLGHWHGQCAEMAAQQEQRGRGAQRLVQLQGRIMHQWRRAATARAWHQWRAVVHEGRELVV